MTWKPYHLDYRAMRLVQAALEHDPKSLNQSFKMRTTCTFGLERFWGEHLRLQQSQNQADRKKGDFAAATWSAFRETIDDVKPGLASRLPNTIPIHIENEGQNERTERINQSVSAAAQLFWNLDIHDQRNCLTLLSALCDAVVWWTQRLKASQSESSDAV
jgi:hypothetical protein